MVVDIQDDSLCVTQTCRHIIKYWHLAIMPIREQNINAKVYPYLEKSSAGKNSETIK